MNSTETKAKKPLNVRSGMFRAIFTKYLGATDRRGSRIKAFDCEGFSVTVNIDYSLRDGENHCAAARKLCEKMNWTGTLVSGGTKDGQVFVFVDSDVLAPEQVLLTCANRDDAEHAHKMLAKQVQNTEQSLSGMHVGILRAAVQRSTKVEIGGAQ